MRTVSVGTGYVKPDPTHVGVNLKGQRGCTHHNRNPLAGSGRTLIKIMLRDAAKDMALIEGYMEVALSGR